MTSVEQHVAADSSTAQRRAVLILVVLATSLTSLEVGLVTVALPALATAFEASPYTIQWVALAYQLAIIGTLMLCGRLVDVLGGRTLYLAGMAAFLAAAMLAVVSPSIVWLILARGLLGLGAAMLLATGQALITMTFRDEGRGRALGVIHMAVAAGLMAGPAIGGLLVTVADWRTIFLAPIPLVVIALVWGWHVLPTSSHQAQGPLDIVGAALIFIAAGMGVLGLSRIANTGWGTSAVVLLTLSLTATALFIAVERWHINPLVELSLLGTWQLSAGLLAALLTFIALASNMFLIPFALQDLMGQSAFQAGLIMMTVPLMILPTAPLAGAVGDRYGVRLPATVGLTAITVSIFAMSRFESTSPTTFAVTVLVIYGIGAGLFQAPNNSAVLGASPDDRVGTISGMLALCRNLGQVIGVALASMIWALRQANYERSTDWPDDRVLGAALGDAFLVLAIIACAALLVSIVRSDPQQAS